MRDQKHTPHEAHFIAKEDSYGCMRHPYHHSPLALYLVTAYIPKSIIQHSVCFHIFTFVSKIIISATGKSNGK
jgi:hypothetical protein